MNFFISDALADTAPAAASGENGTISTMLLVVAMGLIFYFMMIRPQQKRSKDHKKLMDSIAKDEEVITNGGLIGRVTKISENGYLTIALNNSTEVLIRRDSIMGLLPKGTMENMNL